jgi:hypothetical protein
MTSRVKPHLGPGRFSLTVGPTRFHPGRTRLGSGLMRMLNVMQETMPFFSFSSSFVLCKCFLCFFTFICCVFSVWVVFSGFVSEKIRKIDSFFCVGAFGCWEISRGVKRKREIVIFLVVLFLVVIFMSVFCVSSM